MPSNFTYRYVSLVPEHTTSTGARDYGNKSAGGTAQVYGEVDDESLQHRFDLITRADISRYGAAKSMTGKEYSEGGINFVAQADDFLGYLLYGVYGDKSTANSGDYGVSTNTHTWTEDPTHLLPSFTIYVGREDKEHTYTGAVLTRLSLSAAVGEYVSMSADFVGKAESAVGALAPTPTFGGASLDGLHFRNATITFSDGSTHTSSTNVKSISVDWNINVDTDSACSLGSATYVRQPSMQMREITGSVEFSRPIVDGGTTGEPEYKDVIAADGLLYDGTASNPAIKIELVDEGTGDLEIQIRKVRWEAPTNNVSGRDQSTMSLNFVALVDTADDIMSKVVFTTGVSTIGRYSTR